MDGILYQLAKAVAYQAVSRVALPLCQMAHQPFLLDEPCALLAVLPTPPAAELACTYHAQVLHNLTETSMTSIGKLYQHDEYQDTTNIHDTLTQANPAIGERHSATSGDNMTTFAQLD